MEYKITRDDASHRYVISVDGVEAGFAAFAQSGDVLDFDHTEVYEQFQGQGLSKPLIQAALDDVRANGKSIQPTCSAVARFVSKHEEYADLVAH